MLTTNEPKAPPISPESAELFAEVERLMKKVESDIREIREWFEVRNDR